MNKKLMPVALALCLSAWLACAGCQSKQQAQELAVQKKIAAEPHAKFMADFSHALMQHTNGKGMGAQPTHPKMPSKTVGQSPSPPATNP